MPDVNNQNPKISIFISYAHEDEKMKDELVKFLSSLKREGLIDAWHDRLIKPGEEWDDKIVGALHKSCVILLLVSAGFIHSEYIYNKELTIALKRHEDKEVVVIPVILDHCDWHNMPFGKFQALPKDGKPVTSWSPQSEAYTDIVKGIRRVVEDIQTKGLCGQTQKKTK